MGEEAGVVQTAGYRADQNEHDPQYGEQSGQTGKQGAVAAVQLMADLVGITHGLHRPESGLLRRDALLLQRGGMVLQVGGQFLPGHTLGQGLTDDRAHLIAELFKGLAQGRLTSFPILGGVVGADQIAVGIIALAENGQTAAGTGGCPRNHDVR